MKGGNKATLSLARIAVGTALYAVLSFAIMPLAYGQVQFRFSEVIVLLAFYNRDYAYSSVLGCAIVNIFSPLGVIDLFFGTIASLLSVICMRRCRHLLTASLFPTIFCAFVALEFKLTMNEPFWLSYGLVALGEFCVVTIVGVPFMKLLERNKSFMRAIGVDKRYAKLIAERGGDRYPKDEEREDNDEG